MRSDSADCRSNQSGKTVQINAETAETRRAAEGIVFVEQPRLIEAMDPHGTFLESIRPPEAYDAAEYGPIDHRADVYQAGLLFLCFLDGQRYRFSRVEILAGRPRQLAEQ